MGFLNIVDTVEYYGVTGHPSIKPSRWSVEKYVLNKTDKYLWKMIEYHYMDGTISFSKATIIEIYAEIGTNYTFPEGFEYYDLSDRSNINILKSKFKSLFGDHADAVETFCFVIFCIFLIIMAYLLFNEVILWMIKNIL